MLTLLKRHVRTSHVSGFTHIFGGGVGRRVGGVYWPTTILRLLLNILLICVVIEVCAGYRWSARTRTRTAADRQTDMPNKVCYLPPDMYTHPPLLVMSPRISNQHGCITREVCLIDGCMKSPLVCCVYVAMKCVCV